MNLKTTERIEKAQKIVEKMNAKFVNNFIEETNERHVKEMNEPVMDDIIDSFNSNYAKSVVGKSMKEIVKFIKES